MMKHCRYALLLITLTVFFDKDAENWNKSLADSDKLRTYRKYKTILSKDGYCDLPLPRDHRRIYAI